VAQQQTAPEPRYARFNEAREYAGNIPAGTFRDWIRRGILPAYRLGPRLLVVDLNDIDKLRRRVPTVERRASSDKRKAG
jgi:hypothetical protein